MRLVIACCFAFSVTACATKQYPQAPLVSAEESAVLDCQSIKVEIAKTHSVQSEIERTGEFDGKTVLGALGDFGIGNGIAKSEARQKASNRLTQLQSLEAAKCQSQG
ncbi:MULTISPECIES: hypothetical protein [Aeromonas]|jgi:hypothetical protein|uniref:Lipoprotein n=1 Tax=Aeromonas media TaxID=651 RepID=A0A6M4YDK3_AERME|nr:hypothetical protein [Aeromonas media]MDW4560076.1 hypothetical protein [Aeromonas rivipollensis]QJT23327.1 hypothetical protein E4184_19155 [Aeromonas media]